MRLAAIALLTLLPLVAQAPPASARDWMEKGIPEYRSGLYQEAVTSFQHAVDLEPGNVNVRLYLASGLARQCYPGGPASIAEKADAAFRSVLDTDPGNNDALASLGAFHYSIRQPEEAKAWYGRLLQVDPVNKDALYSLGVIAWSQSSAAVRTARADLKMQPQAPGPLPDGNLRYTLREKYGTTIADGMANLESALRLDPNLGQAYAYLSFLYRLRADLEDTAAASAQDIETGNRLVEKALAAAKHPATTPTAAWSLSGPPPPLELVPSAAPQRPPLPPNAGQSSSQRLRVGGDVQAANLIRKVDPVYPPLAMQARIQGTVRFTVTIAKDGTVSNAQLVSGHPLLVTPAVDAVKQWQYKPTLLNGQPIEVVTQVDVIFSLSQ